MADFGANTEQKHPHLNLSTEEQRLFAQVFSAADSENIGVVTGDVALRFLPEKTRLPSEVLGEIWQIADTDDKGFLTPAGFYIILRLIGYAQAGKTITSELATKSGGPLPKFEGINIGPAAPPLQAQGSGGPIRVPPLTPENASKYSQLFQQSGAQNGVLSGSTAKQIFDRARLPNDVLVKIWNLADTEQRGMLSETEFIIAMHLLASYRSGSLKALPYNLPAGLYEAAARRGVPASRPLSGQPPSQASSIPRQFSGSSAHRPSSPLTRPPYTASTITTPLVASDWVITAQEKERYDAQFDNLDSGKQGFVSGEQAVSFFSNSRLPEEDLAQVWDLSDIDSSGQLSRDEFAVAMHLIRQQLAKRGPLPSTLPENLVPPSMRHSNTQQQPQPTPQSPPPKAKSAAEDLFGLDAISATSPPNVQQKEESGSVLPQSSSSPQPSQPAHSTTFKPFVPSSSFGQSIVSPQPTGTSQASNSRVQPVNDDLLGDTDPEVNKRLTNETTELANLSNQVGNLSNQMQDVKNKRGTAEQSMSQVSAQKRDFETRLTSLRGAYEQEARDLRSLEEKLANLRNEAKKVQADLAMVQHTYNGLVEKRQKIETDLEADQKENANLKERVRLTNIEISQLKPQLEKLQSDARQQKGLVAINKKQLSTNEAERDRLKGDISRVASEYHEASKELEESSKSLERQKSISPQPTASPIASPVPSTTSQSTNPFFRRTTTGGSQQESARSPFVPEPSASPNHSAFDSFFASAMPAPGPAPGPFNASDQGLPLSSGMKQDQPEVEIPSQDIIRPGQSVTPEPKTPSQNDLPPASQLPPPPPQSRQITSSSLPLREAVVGPPSEGSSVGVAPPASRFGDSGLNTPVTDRQTSRASAGPVLSPLGQNFTGDSSRDAQASQPSSSSGVVTPQEAGQSIPGSFPGEEGPSTPVPPRAPKDSVDNPFDGTNYSQDSQSVPSSTKDDFDSAFAGFGGKEKGPESFPKSKPSQHDEFPPIQEFDDDDDSSDESEKGFDDNFAPPTGAESSQDTKKIDPDNSESKNVVSMAESPRPELHRVISDSSSQLPPANAQPSPPTYEQTFSPMESSKTRKDSTQFPAEYTGLLPPRVDPTSPDLQGLKPDDIVRPSIDAQNSSTMAYSPPTARTPAPQDSSAGPSKSLPKDAFDDFDNAFGDLAEAQPADDKGDEEFGSQRDNHYFDEFNPTFDSPAPSKTTTSSAFQESAFSDFEPNHSGPTQAFVSNSSTSAQPAASHDWDDIFSGLDSGNANGNGVENKDSLSTPKPPLTRALSTGTEHDDPILKQLTAMGYPRDKSLAALEKFDYNLDKAADYLTSKS